MSNANGWLSFAQRPREQGGLGLQKHQAAGLVGNLVYESGQDLPAWGPSGDNGTAWGTAQWRGPRLEQLKALYPNNYQTVEAQQAFMRYELDGTENRAYQALQAATTPEDAARAFDERYERSDGSTRGKRELSARKFYDGSDGPTAIETAMGHQPSTGSTAMGFEPETQPALKPQQDAGVLSSMGDYFSNMDWGNSIGGAGRSLAAIGNPELGAALTQNYAAMKKPQGTQGTWSQSIDPTTGVGTMINSATGQRQTFQAHAPKVEKEEKVDGSVLKGLATDWTEKYGNLHYAAEKAAEYKKKIDSGELDLSLAARGTAAWESAFGKSSPQSKLYNEFQSYRTQLANDSLRLNNGVQTEGDANRAREELVTTFGSMDPKTTATALGNFVSKTGKVMQDGARGQLDSYSANYKNKAPFQTYYDRLGKQQKFYDDFGTESAAAASAPAATSPRSRPPLGSIFK